MPTCWLIPRKLTTNIKLLVVFSDVAKGGPRTPGGTLLMKN